MTIVRVRVPAAAVKLSPGFGAISMALNLHNTIEASLPDEGFRFRMKGSFAEDDQRDDLIGISRILFQKIGVAPSALSLSLDAGIPFKAGLGGQTAMRVGAVTALNVLLGSPLSRDDIATIVIESGGTPASVMAMVNGGLSVCSQRGDEFVCSEAHLTPLPLGLITPKLSNSVMSQPTETPSSLGDGLLIVRALGAGDLDLLSRVLDDPFREHQAVKSLPGFMEAVESAQSKGASVALLNGESPSLLVFAREDKLADILEKMTQALSDGAVDQCHSWITSADTQGISISETGGVFGQSVDLPIPVSDLQVAANLPKNDK